MNLTEIADVAARTGPGLTVSSDFIGACFRKASLRIKTVFQCKIRISK
jgi:hypothetical protein